MFSTLVIIMVALFALLGGIANGMLAWARQNPPEPFDLRKFLVSFITAFIAAVGIAAVFDYANIKSIALAYLGAFLSGAGATSAVSNISGAIAMRALATLNKATLKK
jgi:hydrogenase/urease accessory protein HupE